MNVYPVTLAAGLVMLASCSGTVNLVRPSRPHATLVVDVSHRGTSESGYQDLLVLDGLEYAVGTGEGGKLSIVMGPGKHEVRLVSAPLRAHLKVFDVMTIRPVDQGNVWTNVRAYDTSMQLGTEAESICMRTVSVDFQQGQTVQTKLVSSADGTCVIEGV